MTDGLDFTTDDIAIGIELPGVYDGVAVWLLKDGRFVNRFRQSPGWSPHRVKAADEWIANHGATLPGEEAGRL